MANFLTQDEADFFIKLEKEYKGKESFNFPDLGGKLIIPLVGKKSRESFLLDITRNNINIKKNTFQNRIRTSIVLARLDIFGPPHRNPDKKVISGSHLHIYKENYGDAWAIELPEEFANCKESIDFLYVFLDYCNITKKPIITKGLFHESD